MDKGICVAVPGTVTISAEEFAELVTSRAYLSVIMEAQATEKNYVVENIVEVVSHLVHPVITGDSDTSEDAEAGTDA